MFIYVRVDSSVLKNNSFMFSWNHWWLHNKDELKLKDSFKLIELCDIQEAFILLILSRQCLLYCSQWGELYMGTHRAQCKKHTWFLHFDFNKVNNVDKGSEMKRDLSEVHFICFYASL